MLEKLGISKSSRKWKACSMKVNRRGKVKGKYRRKILGNSSNLLYGYVTTKLLYGGKIMDIRVINVLYVLR
jgi:hypothetical protein